MISAKILADGKVYVFRKNDETVEWLNHDGDWVNIAVQEAMPLESYIEKTIPSGTDVTELSVEVLKGRLAEKTRRKQEMDIEILRLQTKLDLIRKGK